MKGTNTCHTDSKEVEPGVKLGREWISQDNQRDYQREASPETSEGDPGGVREGAGRLTDQLVPSGDKML